MVEKNLSAVPGPKRKRRSELVEARRERENAQRAEVLSLLMAGLSYEQIAERQGTSKANIQDVVKRALASQEGSGIATMRAVENARLDRVQFAIWPDALKGDTRAIQTYLQISARRSRLNGLDAPLQIEMSAHIRIEMQQALNDLSEIVLGEVIPDDYSSETDWTGEARAE